ncbi:helix-turn-helix transcriptional regulator [Rhizobium sp. CG5]|uniref:ArsR/SmtB family transcription factor n=1 Tax=Rhizobium sp. CG5 TaxID=2726076 RepID=UPI002033397A|nr:helix-turn-helix domain-containing protein [Rhizobium sp. CG5]MCM2477301.1 helix-turn-helix transcriptional regulator [Rhizobium sp. CG5]
MAKRRDVPRIIPGIPALKALAHADRLRILASLRISGPSTATELARRFGHNSGATSYHLRQLATHGFIEPAPELGNARERWWRAVHESTVYETAELKGSDLEAGLAFSQAVLSAHAHMMQRAQEAYRDLPVPWRKASTNSDFIIPLTAAAAEALTQRIFDLLMEAQAASPPSGTALTPGTMPMAYVLYAFPYPEAEPGVEGAQP